MIYRTRVINLYKEDCDIYIGRGNHPQHIGIDLGNPWTHYKQSRGLIYVPTREEAILHHKNWLDNIEGYKTLMPKRRAIILENLYRLIDKRLGCFCKPNCCHGDNYIILIGKLNA